MSKRSACGRIAGWNPHVFLTLSVYVKESLGVKSDLLHLLKLNTESPFRMFLSLVFFFPKDRHFAYRYIRCFWLKSDTQIVQNKWLIHRSRKRLIFHSNVYHSLYLFKIPGIRICRYKTQVNGIPVLVCTLIWYYI